MKWETTHRDVPMKRAMMIATMPLALGVCLPTQAPTVYVDVKLADDILKKERRNIDITEEIKAEHEVRA